MRVAQHDHIVRMQIWSSENKTPRFEMKLIVFYTLSIGIMKDQPNSNFFNELQVEFRFEKFQFVDFHSAARNAGGFAFESFFFHFHLIL